MQCEDAVSRPVVANGDCFRLLHLHPAGEAMPRCKPAVICLSLRYAVKSVVWCSSSGEVEARNTGHQHGHQPSTSPKSIIPMQPQLPLILGFGFGEVGSRLCVAALLSLEKLLH